jgi:PD-(D/E)XK nuclease superfamily
MALPNGSASAVERLIACPAWPSLPRVEVESEDAASGHAKHGYIAAVLSGTPVDVALAAVLEEADRRTCRQLDWRALVGDADDLESEAAFAIDVKRRTARRLGHNLGRDYEGAARRLGRRLGSWEIPGSIDLLGRRKVGGVRLVRDYKSGYQDVTHAADNGQLKFFAAAVYLIEGETAVEADIAKIKPDGSVFYLRDGGRATFTPLDLDAFLDELEAAVAETHKARALVRYRKLPTVYAGPHCKYCEAANACPAKTTLARAFIGTLDAMKSRFAIMTREERGRAYELLTYQAKPLLRDLEAALKESIFAEGPRGVPLSNGKIARASSYETSRTSSTAAIDLARELGATEAQLEECEKTFTVTQVREVNAPRAKKGNAA